MTCLLCLARVALTVNPLCEFASRILVATGGHVCVLSERGVATERHHQSDLCRHDALHVHRDIVLDLDVHLARAHAVVA